MINTAGLFASENRFGKKCLVGSITNLSAYVESQLSVNTLDSIIYAGNKLILTKLSLRETLKKKNNFSTKAINMMYLSKKKLGVYFGFKC